MWGAGDFIGVTLACEDPPPWLISMSGWKSPLMEGPLTTSMGTCGTWLTTLSGPAKRSSSACDFWWRRTPSLRPHLNGPGWWSGAHPVPTPGWSSWFYQRRSRCLARWWRALLPSPRWAAMPSLKHQGRGQEGEVDEEAGQGGCWHTSSCSPSSEGCHCRDFWPTRRPKPGLLRQSCRPRSLPRHPWRWRRRWSSRRRS